MKTTEKNLKEAVNCDCGYNTSEDYKRTVTVKQLKIEGYKKRRYKNTGEVFYFFAHTECEACLIKSALKVFA